MESKAINNKKSGKIITINKEGKQIIQNKSDLVRETKITNDSDSNDKITVMSPRGSGWSLVSYTFSFTWKQFGYLYKQSVVKDKKVYQLNISAGTYLSTILGIIDIIGTKGTLSAVLRTFGYAITGSVVDSIISGPLEGIRYQDNLEVWSQDELGLRTYQYIVYVKHNGKLVKASDGGDTRSYSDMLHAGIYNVVLNNLYK